MVETKDNPPVKTEKGDALDPEKLAKETGNKLEKEGVIEAYNYARDEMNKTRAQLEAGGVNPQEQQKFSKFQKDFSSELERLGFADDLSFAWARRAKDRLDFNNKGTINSVDVRAHIKDTDAFTVTMGKHFIQQLDGGKFKIGAYDLKEVGQSELDNILQDRTGDRRRAISESAKLQKDEAAAKQDEKQLNSALAQKTSDGKEIKLIDALVAASGNEGSFNRDDIDKVLKLKSIFGLSDGQAKYLEDLKENWDKEQGLRLREKGEKDTYGNTASPKDRITLDSIKVATGDQRRQDESISGSDDQLKRQAESAASSQSQKDVDFLTNVQKHFIGNDSGTVTSLFDAADQINGNPPEKKVTRDKIQKMLAIADVLALTKDEKAFLKRLDDGWDSDPSVKRLRTEGTGQYASLKDGITLDSMKTATGQTEIEAQQKIQAEKLAEQKKLDEAADQLRKDKELASAKALEILNRRVGGTTLLNAADVAGAINNDRSWWWKSGNTPDGKVSEGDLRELLKNPTISVLLSDDDRKLIEEIRKGQNDPKSPYHFLYDKDGYITQNGLDRIALKK